MEKRGDRFPQENKVTERTAQHTVEVTKNLGEERRKEIVSFINEHIAEYKGKTEDRTSGRHGIPMMVFERQQDAHIFANEMSKRLDFPREHIDVKPRSNHVQLNREDVIRQ
jgi:hypothetical protein